MLHLPFDETNDHVYDHSAIMRIDRSGVLGCGKNGGAVTFDGMNDGLVFEKIAEFDRPDVFGCLLVQEKQKQVYRPTIRLII